MNRAPHAGRSFNYTPCLHTWPCPEHPEIPHLCLWGVGHRNIAHTCQCGAIAPFVGGAVGREAAGPGHSSSPEKATSDTTLTAPCDKPRVRAVEQVGGDAQPPLRVPPADHRSAS